MENWGLVTYRTTAVLFDEKSSDAKYKNRVAYVVAHELAHQWFGNLVSWNPNNAISEELSLMCTVGDNGLVE
jgi:aminopeptidase N